MREHSSGENSFYSSLSLLPLVAVSALSIACAAPWYFASTPWIAQYWLVLAGAATVGGLVANILLRLSSPNVGPKLAAPWLTLTLLAAACYAFVQSIPYFDGVSSKADSAPASVQIQRWFLGVPNASLDERFGISVTNVAESTSKSESGSGSENDLIGQADELIDRHPFRLAISIEPLHTRAAIGSLVLAAVMVWIGSVCFTSPKWQISLVLVISVLGIVIGMLGLAHALSWQKVNWLGLAPGSSFATFVSRNSAGGFMNVCLSAALGLATWTFLKPYNPNDFYIIRNPNPLLEFLRKIESGFAKLTTPQIASVLAVAFLLAAVGCTTSRGATIGGVAACSVVLLLFRNREQSYGRVVFAMIVVLLGLGLIFFFEFDERISKRFEELFKIENQLKDGRSYIWGVALKAFSFFIATGSGLGTFHYAYLPFQTPNSGGWYYHAESLFMQTLVEFGWIGICLLALVLFQMMHAIKVLGSHSSKPSMTESVPIKPPQYLPAYVTGLSLVVSLGVHCLVDFPLIVPAVFIPAALLAGMVCGVARAKSTWEAFPPMVSMLRPSSEPRSRYPLAEPSVDLTGLGERTTHNLGGVPESSSETNAINSQSSRSQSSNSPPSRRSRRSSSELSERERQRSRRGTSRPTSLKDVESLAGQQLSWERYVYRGSSRATLGSTLSIGALAIVLMLSSLSSMDALDRSDAMAKWVTSHEQLPREKRISSPSSYLVGLWGDSTIPIDQAPSALRMIADAILYEFRSQLYDEIQENVSGARKVGWEETSPLLMNALLNGLIDADPNGKSKKKPAEIAGGTKQLARWDKAYELLEKARQACPLDWRLSWGEVLLNRTLSRNMQLRHLQLAGILSGHRAENLFQIGVLTREAGDLELAIEFWRQTLRLSPGYGARVASIIALDLEDEKIPVDIFADDLGVLKQITTSPFTEEKFPVTHALLWERMKAAAEALPAFEPGRWQWLAEIASKEGDTEKELDCLRQASSKQPMNQAIRMYWAGRLANEGFLDEAIEQAEFCRTLAPDDLQVQDALRRWKELRDKDR
jgi:tetratricopeptide (TPR) repeat protein